MLRKNIPNFIGLIIFLVFYIWVFFAFRFTEASYLSGTLMILPIVLVSWSFGTKIGTLFAVVLVITHFYLAGQYYPQSQQLFLQRLFGGPALVFIGFMIGYSRNSAIKFGNLQKQLQILHLGLEKSQDIVFTTDENGEFEYVNPAFIRKYGYSIDEIRGKTPRLLKSGDKDEDFYKNFWSEIKSGNDVRVIMNNKSKDGKLLVLESSVNPVVNHKGKVIGFLAIQRDITEKNKIQTDYEKRSMELQRLNDLMVDRELKMIELKKKIKDLEKYKN
jgi:PAS domain S-box-containing protein